MNSSNPSKHFDLALDQYFGNVCELDVIFNFERVHTVIDEILMGGEIQETSLREIKRVLIPSILIILGQSSKIFLDNFNFNIQTVQKEKIHRSFPLGGGECGYGSRKRAQ